MAKNMNNTNRNKSTSNVNNAKSAYTEDCGGRNAHQSAASNSKNTTNKNAADKNSSKSEYNY